MLRYGFGLVVAIAAAWMPGVVRAEFALKDGDTVAFLGDSLTAARGYTKIVEHYTLMRFPERHVSFVNAGEGGDTASKCLERLERDVFSKGATVVTVAFGINDIGWGTKADAEHKKAYLDGIRTIIERCRERNVRPFICSAAITDIPPDEAEKGFLQAMVDEGMALAKSMGAETIDLQRGMREIQRRVIRTNAGMKEGDTPVALHSRDGVHLEELGQLAMGYCMLKGLGAPEDVSSVVMDARQGTLVSASGCTVTDIVAEDGSLHFTRLDRGLPLNLGPLTPLNYQWVPMHDGINRYLLKVNGLPEGEYELRAEDRGLGRQTAAQLAQGVNLSSMTENGWYPGGPWDAQSCVVKELVDARDRLWMAGSLQNRLLANHPGNDDVSEGIRKVEDDLVIEQRKAARPYSYRFSIRKVARAE